MSKEQLDKKWIDDEFLVRGYIHYYNHHLQQYKQYNNVPENIEIELINVGELKNMSIKGVDKIAKLRDILDGYIREFKNKR